MLIWQIPQKRHRPLFFLTAETADCKKFQSTELQFMNQNDNGNKITLSIFPKRSIGGISLGEQIADVIIRFSPGCSVEKANNHTSFDDGLVTAYHDDLGFISSLSCNSTFKGAYLGILWPGMTVADVMKKTSVQIAFTGFVQVERIEGVGLSLPNDRDDFERLDDEFEDNYVFEELWVY